MINPSANIDSTPMAPYVGILNTLNKRDRQIVIEYLQQTQPVEDDNTAEPTENIVMAVRAKFNIPESPVTLWFKNQPITLSEDELADERTKHILGK